MHERDRVQQADPHERHEHDERGAGQIARHHDHAAIEPVGEDAPDGRGEDRRDEAQDQHDRDRGLVRGQRERGCDERQGRHPVAEAGHRSAPGADGESRWTASRRRTPAWSGRAGGPRGPDRSRTQRYPPPGRRRVPFPSDRSRRRQRSEPAARRGRRSWASRSCPCTCTWAIVRSATAWTSLLVNCTNACPPARPRPRHRHLRRPTSSRRFAARRRTEILCVTVAASMSSPTTRRSRPRDEFAGTVEVVDSLLGIDGGGVRRDGGGAGRGRGCAAGRGRAPGPRRRRRHVPVCHRGHVRPPAAVRPGDPPPGVRGHRAGHQAGLRAFATAAVGAWRAPGHAAARWTASSTRPSRPPRVGPCAWPSSTRWPRTTPARWPTGVESAVSVLERFVVEVTPVVGVHVGPGLVGTAIHPDPG